RPTTPCSATRRPMVSGSGPDSAASNARSASSASIPRLERAAARTGPNAILIVTTRFSGRLPGAAPKRCRSDRLDRLVDLLERRKACELLQREGADEISGGCGDARSPDDGRDRGQQAGDLLAVDLDLPCEL